MVRITISTSPLPLHIHQSVDTFQTTSWEQQPRLFKATPERVAFFRGLLSLPHYLELARRREASGRFFHCAKDVNAARYRQGKRETLTVEVRECVGRYVCAWVVRRCCCCCC